MYSDFVNACVHLQQVGVAALLGCPRDINEYVSPGTAELTVSWGSAPRFVGHTLFCDQEFSAFPQCFLISAVIVMVTVMIIVVVIILIVVIMVMAINFTLIHPSSCFFFKLSAKLCVVD